MESKDIEKYKLKIDSFLNGEIDHSAMSSFLENIEDKKVKQELIDYVDIKTNIRIEGEKELKKKYLKLLKQENASGKIINLTETKSKKAKTFSLSTITKIASVFLLLFACYFAFDNISPTPSSSEDIFADPPISLMRTTGENNFSESWEKAMISFQQQDYETALSHITDIEMENVDLQKYLGKISLYKGVCEMRLGQDNKALRTWDKIDELNPYYDQKLWYKAILYTKANYNLKAKNQLKKITNLESHYKKSEAEELLKSLE